MSVEQGFAPDQSHTELPLNALLHGSFRKDFAGIAAARDVFQNSGVVNVLAPTEAEIAAVRGGFVFFKDQEERDPREIELEFLRNLLLLGTNGFSYVFNPQGKVGASASHELGHVNARGVRSFYLKEPEDPPLYVPKSSIWKPEDLTKFIQDNGELPPQTIEAQDDYLQSMQNSLMKTQFATGGIIEYSPGGNRTPLILLVRTHQWQNETGESMLSVVGERVRMNENIVIALYRGIEEETGLHVDRATGLCTFSQIGGKHYTGSRLIFPDYVAEVSSQAVRLNSEAESYMWIDPNEALTRDDVEPNALYSIQQYTQRSAAQIKLL